MANANTWVGYLTLYARHIQHEFVAFRGRKQRKRAIARLYPLPRNESNKYRRRVWTRVCREQIALHRLRKHPGRFRLTNG